MAKETKDESDISIGRYVESESVGRDSRSLAGERILSDGSKHSIRLNVHYFGSKGFFVGTLHDIYGEAFVNGRMCSRFLTFEVTDSYQKHRLSDSKVLPVFHQAERVNDVYTGVNTHKQSKDLSKIIFTDIK
ncbi:hypothetical protein JXB27_03910 [Candidatus Woesearchaeota archaeon]|nr:hypothetical protein [Candidatus Woesearchaeota archaeon]